MAARVLFVAAAISSAVFPVVCLPRPAEYGVEKRLYTGAFGPGPVIIGTASATLGDPFTVIAPGPFLTATATAFPATLIAPGPTASPATATGPVGTHPTPASTSIEALPVTTDTVATPTAVGDPQNVSSVPIHTAAPEPPTIVIAANTCPPPAATEVAGTWLATDFGQSADDILGNSAQAYNQLVLPWVAGCSSLDDATDDAREFAHGHIFSLSMMLVADLSPVAFYHPVTNFYALYSSAEDTLHSANDTSAPRQRALVSDAVCQALEAVEALVTEVTVAKFGNGVCLSPTTITSTIPADDTIIDEVSFARRDGPAQVQQVAFDCGLASSYSFDARPYLITEISTLIDPQVSLASPAEDFGCRGEITNRMARRERQLVAALRKREAGL
ncbi:hypothetical protein HKX48_005709 [Thoreauomyces humboldtii]|nr:hypothetical protein HKX48_005709 [Thoreauomyces humboldtii]